ncbi:peptide deformylase [Sinosporangium album]|uniref:Peptide deformylase-like n=1 Tax=Sinosporangium album TaxID=504805 RepID=A0A1G8AKM8_9ACTN|nr:peptide deformylase [Sinosporangium album]SDH21366.1 peptide deformylase [Sinosporangium album]
MTGDAPRAVLTAPHPLLTTPAEPVDATDPRVVALAAELLAALRTTRPSTGLAAPQIGTAVRLIAADVSLHPHARSCAGEVVLVNPRLVAASGWRAVREGCLSVPGLTGETVRASEITVRGELPGSGDAVTLRADAVEALCLQHQLDHLDGLLFLDRIVEASALHPVWQGLAAPALTRPRPSQPAPIRGS